MANDSNLRVGDFDDDVFGIGKGGGKGVKRLRADDRGEPRSYLRAYETMPVQWLNAYGQAQFNQLSDKAV